MESHLCKLPALDAYCTKQHCELRLGRLPLLCLWFLAVFPKWLSMQLLWVGLYHKRENHLLVENLAHLRFYLRLLEHAFYQSDQSLEDTLKDPYMVEAVLPPLQALPRHFHLPPAPLPVVLQTYFLLFELQDIQLLYGLQRQDVILKLPC